MKNNDKKKINLIFTNFMVSSDPLENGAEKR